MHAVRLATVGAAMLVLRAEPPAAQEPGHQGHEATVALTNVAAGDRTPLYDNLGTYHMPVTTGSPLAQRYFDQGIRLTYGFNHDEAIKSFREALRADSTCAMCWWGIAYALGPNINAPMDTAAEAPAYQALMQAVHLAPGAGDRDRAYIRALQARYSSAPLADRSPLDTAWSRAIGRVARQFPRDDDAATLYAESLMDLRPWNYWNNAGRPRAPSTLASVAVLERIVKRRLDHPGACHFYIHAIEASNFAARAVPCAERLGSLVPGAGHLVHMPTHIYMRLGRWDEAADHNAEAVHVDERYVAARHPTGVYPVGYVPHNYHVMWEALNMLGRSGEALGAARTITAKVPAEVVRASPPFEYYTPVVLFTLARFSRWDDILKEPPPPADLRYTAGVWHYTRGLAHAARGALDSASTERDSVAAIAATIPPGQAANLNSARVLLRIAERHLAGEIAWRGQRTGEAVAALRAGIALEDELTYDEPAAWPLPLRQQLGGVLLAAGRGREAETAFREDLVRYPNNGWSLRGLARALEAQGRRREAAAAEARFRKAWARADVPPAQGTN